MLFVADPDQEADRPPAGTQAAVAAGRARLDRLVQGGVSPSARNASRATARSSSGSAIAKVIARSASRWVWVMELTIAGLAAAVTLWVPVIRFMSGNLRVLMDQPAESIPSDNPALSSNESCMARVLAMV
jgi:hypothetical protein